jgi:Na+/melibiose symporter-like transporter
MEDNDFGDELKPRLTTLFYSSAATILDAVTLYFVIVLSPGNIDAADMLVTIMCAGLLFPCIAGILVTFFWERKNIFVYSMILYGLIIFAGSIYYISLSSSPDIWGILFALIGVVVTYVAIRHLRRSRTKRSG